MKPYVRIIIFFALPAILLSMKPAGRPTIYVFLQSDCPCVYSHKDSFGSLLRNYSNKVNFQLIFVGKEDSAPKIEELLKQLDWKVSFKKDSGLQLLKRYQPKVSTDCVVLDKNNRVLYKGAIDDAVKNMGMVKNFYLKNVIDAVLLGKSAPYSNVAGTGCSLM